MAADGEKEPESRSLLRDYGATLFIAVLVAMAIRFFGIEAYRLPTAAMRPTLESGDTVFVSKSAYGIRLPWTDKTLGFARAPRYGEVVVYTHPSNPPRDSMKRVVALPGDTVEFKDGRLILNGKPVSSFESPNSPCGTETLPGATYGVCWEPPLLADHGPEKIPDGFVFLVGDARTKGESRPFPTFITVPWSALKGKALWIWLSIQPSGSATGFSRIRFERMFKSVE